MQRKAIDLSDMEGLQRLIAEGESETLEFKKSLGLLQAGMETLCGFLNGRGGIVLFGVSQDGHIVGQQIVDKTLQEVGNALKQLEPPADVQQVRIPVRSVYGVLALVVDRGGDRPYTYDGRPYKRTVNTTHKMSGGEYQQILVDRLHSVSTWENRVASGYALDDLDHAEVERTIAAAQEKGRLGVAVTGTADALERLGLKEGDSILQGGVVAFGVRLLPNYPQCSLRLARLKGTTKTEFTDQHQLTGHAFKLLEEAAHFLTSHLPVAGRIEPGLWERKDQPVFPTLALREALVNALCHRDYSIPGGAVSVAIFDDRLEIASTGALPQGITVEDLKRDHSSRPRNPLLADLFYK